MFCQFITILALCKFVRMKVVLNIILISLLLGCSTEKKLSGPLITLTNGTIEIGLIPAVGGVLVRASLAGKTNILNSDSTLWNESPDKRPSLDPKAPFKTYNGHITWLSPQSEWWIRQDSFPDLKESRSLWPPDPILTLAPYRIIQQTATEITMESPESPFSKVQFTKIYSLDRNTVTLTTVAKNISEDTISWGLWHNTRMNGWDAVFVQADSAALRKTDHYNRDGIQKPQLQFRDGFYSYESVQPEKGSQVYKSKSFLNVKTPLIAGYHKNQWLIIRSEAIEPQLIHPNEARVEIYIENSANPANDLQELELQFAYEKIAPGATIQAIETWEIWPGTGLQNKSELLEEIKLKFK